MLAVAFSFEIMKENGERRERMNILHLTPEAHELLQNWDEENRLLVDSVLPYNKSYFKKLCLDYGSQCMLDSEGPLRVYIEAKPHHEEFRAKFCENRSQKARLYQQKDRIEQIIHQTQRSSSTFRKDWKIIMLSLSTL